MRFDSSTGDQDKINISMEQIEVLKNIDVTDIIDCYWKLDPDITWTKFDEKSKQAGLQYRNGDDPWTSAVGKMSGRLNSCNEYNFDQLNPFFKGTVFERIIDELGFYRARLMWVYPFTCYTMHRDTSRRIHVPLISNEHCYFVFKNMAPVHLEVGKVYITDTRKFHTFMNCSDRPRLHLVGVID
jgi:hypothetical protein